MSTHSILPPSSAGIWGPENGCTGYIMMAQLYPETEDNEAALEGTAAHEIGAELIQYAARGVNSTQADEFIGEVASNGVVFTKEMFDGAKMYADDVSEVMRTIGVFGGDNFGNEEKVKAPHIIHELSEGTLDQRLYDDRSDGGTLYMWDFKFGHEVVEAFENWQTINYVAGVISDADRCNINNWDPQFITVVIRIVQPRAHHADGPIREWVVKLSELKSYFEQLHKNAHIALGDNSELRTGSHCKHCHARHACQPYLLAGMSLFEMVGRPVPVELSPAALGVQLAIVNRGYELFKSLKTAYNEQVKSVIRGGVMVPNFSVEMGYGKLAWSKPVAEIIQLGEIYGTELKKPDDVITPTQAKAAGIDAEIIKEYSTNSKTGLKIVPDNGNKARQIFSK